MDFLIHSRASEAAASAADDDELDERHWAYMDGFADGMTARGPTLDRERDAWTGSMHVVSLSGPEVAREFVADEPYQQAGLFAGHRVWRFDNLLGRTMWDYASSPDEPLFLVLTRVLPGAPPGQAPVPCSELPRELAGRLAMYGGLLDAEDGRAVGVAMAVQAPSREALDTLLHDPAAGLEHHELEVHGWEFGGRR